MSDGTISEAEVTITEDDYRCFLAVRDDGSVNMASRRAGDMAGLSQAEHKELLKNFDKYKEKFDSPIPTGATDG